MQLIQMKPMGGKTPYGLSREYFGSPVCLRLPMFLWKGRAYQIQTDDFRSGWWVKDLYIRFGAANNAMGA